MVFMQIVCECDIPVCCLRKRYHQLLGDRERRNYSKYIAEIGNYVEMVQFFHVSIIFLHSCL